LTFIVIAVIFGIIWIGVMLVAVVMFLPNGIWPAIARRFRLHK
jgi:ABC-type branched-subunit amino acid transport system permease subunit